MQYCKNIHNFLGSNSFCGDLNQQVHIFSIPKNPLVIVFTVKASLKLYFLAYILQKLINQNG